MNKLDNSGMRRMILSIIIVYVIIPSPAPKEICLIINNKGVVLKHKIINIERIQFVSAKELAKVLGLKFKQDAKQKKITISSKKTSLEFKQNSLYVNGKSVRLNKSLVIKDKTYYIPVKFTAEKMGYKYRYDNDSNTIELTK